MHTKLNSCFYISSHSTLFCTSELVSLVSAAAFIRPCESHERGFGAILWPWLCWNMVLVSKEATPFPSFGNDLGPWRAQIGPVGYTCILASFYSVLLYLTCPPHPLCP